MIRNLLNKWRKPKDNEPKPDYSTGPVHCLPPVSPVAKLIGWLLENHPEAFRVRKSESDYEEIVCGTGMFLFSIHRRAGYPDMAMIVFGNPELSIETAHGLTSLGPVDRGHIQDAVKKWKRQGMERSIWKVAKEVVSK